MMIFTDSNRVLLEHPQPVGGAVLAKKLLTVESVKNIRKATLFIHAAKIGRQAKDLVVTLNGRRLKAFNAKTSTFAWRAVNVPVTRIKTGANEIVLSSESATGSTWQVSLTSTAHPAKSFASIDNGQRWTNQHLGRLSAVTGELIVRLKLDNGKAIPQPAFVAENPKCDELKRIREMLPKSIIQTKDPFTQMRRLCTYIAKRLTYFNTNDCSSYAPWNFWQILQANAENEAAIKKKLPPRRIVMCVHFGVAFVQAATAMGAKVRCTITTGGLGSGNGHFFPEVFFDELNKWVVIDPTGDFHFINDEGQPASAVELYDNRRKLKNWIRFGPGWEKHKKRLASFRTSSIVKGGCYRNVGYWRRTDFFTHPESTASGHGSITYCEPDIVWIKGDDPLIEAFPHDCRHMQP